MGIRASAWMRFKTKFGGGGDVDLAQRHYSIQYPHIPWEIYIEIRQARSLIPA
jgi:hypothetical protein